MIFKETPLKGAFVLEVEERSDDRGLFARTFCKREFEAHGLNPTVSQCNLNFNHKAGTLRGMHFQVPPAAEVKLVRCTRGRVYDVIVDMRKDSETYLQHFGVELSADNRKLLYVPELFAHGYQALEDNSEVAYQVSEFYAPGQEGGLRYDDPDIGIDWPQEVTVVSDKDSSWTLLKDGALNKLKDSDRGDKAW